jgi:uncharacterized cupredoxin-like copper-binding protein
MFLGSLFLLMQGAGRWSLDARVGSGGRRTLGSVAALLAILFAIGLGAGGCQAGPSGALPYRPQRREVTLTTVPLLTKEMQKVYPFLSRDFAPGGVLAGKEVYAFMPSTVTVLQGDTIHFRLVNPEDDLHSFVLGQELSVALPGMTTTTATYVARQAGIFTFTCSIPAHLPEMWGQLVVLSPEAVGKTGAGPGPMSGRETR